MNTNDQKILNFKKQNNTYLQGVNFTNNNFTQNHALPFCENNSYKLDSNTNNNNINKKSLLKNIIRKQCDKEN